MSKIRQRLETLGVVLPNPSAPVANYAPFVRHGGLVHVSGQLSVDDLGGVKGRVGVDVDPVRARQAARLCGVNLIVQFERACDGDLDRLEQVVRLGGYVQAGPQFTDIPQVLNGCSDLMVEVFADAGRHARSAVGVYKNPLGFAVEVDAIIAVRG